MCRSPGMGAEDVGIRKRRVASRLSETRGVRKVSACDRDGVAQADGGLMLPVVLRPSPGESISVLFGFPHVGKVLEGAPMVKDVEEAQKLPVNPARGRHYTRQEGVGGAQPCGVASRLTRYRATLVPAVVSRSLLTSRSRRTTLITHP